MESGPTIGVLAVQGNFREHAAMLRRLGVDVVEVRKPEQLEGVDGLVIPGGESTTIYKLAERFGLLEPLRAAVRGGLPAYGSCAGMILLGREVLDGRPDQQQLGALDAVVRRNAFGRQVDSFETDLDVPALGDAPLHAVFIRAPVVENAGPEVEVLARDDRGRPVAVRQRRIIATAFHPELTSDRRFHRLLVSMIGAPTDASVEAAA